MQYDRRVDGRPLLIFRALARCSAFVHIAAMADSILRQVIARLQEAIRTPNLGLGPDVYTVRGYDVRVLFETIKRYGGRRDWTPTEDNILQLPAPVRDHVIAQRIENGQLLQKLIASDAERRKLERIVAELRHPRR